MQVTSRLGYNFEVDISDSACAPFGFKHGDIVIDPDGDEVKVMGVAPKNAGKGGTEVLWLAWNNDGGRVAYWRTLGDKNLRQHGFRLK